MDVGNLDANKERGERVEFHALKRALHPMPWTSHPQTRT